MGRAFYSIDQLGMPYSRVRELCFILPEQGPRRQKSRLPKLVILLRGSCYIEAGKDFRHLMEPGDMVILPSPCHHYYELAKGSNPRIYAFSIFFDPRILQANSPKHTTLNHERELLEIAHDLLAEKRYHPHLLTPTVSSIISALRKEQDEGLKGKDIRSSIYINSLLVEIWRILNLHEPATSLRTRSHSYVINEVKELLAKSNGTQISLAEIAWHVRWSEEHLARTFKKETGLTVMEYLRGMRLDAARIRLLQTSESVSSIAHQLGFTTVGNFCRAFKDTIGQTPSEYRENHPGERGK